MGKKAHEGEQDNFQANYRPYGARNQPSDRLPGSPQARLANRYGKNERAPGGDMMSVFAGLFGRSR